MNDATKYAWAAGFLDGEGYIGVQRKLAPNRWRKDPTQSHGVTTPFVRHAIYKLSVAATQRNRASLEALQVLFGGLIRQRKLLGRGDIKYFEWALSSDKALACLEAVSPYLVNKHAVAVIAIEFGRWYSTTKSVRRIGGSMSDERRQRASDYCDAIKQVNRLYRDVPEQCVRVRLPLDADGCVRDDGVSSRSSSSLHVVNGKARSESVRTGS